MILKNLFIICFFLIGFSGYLHSQPKCHIEHYGLADGLPERSIMNILQDKKGFMWFATWDGLCKFDGYNFITYKSSQEDSIFMKSNRIDRICEDIYGHIWVHTYGRETFRFDPRKEEYVAAFHLANDPFSTSRVLPMASGRVWLTSEDTGAICIPDTTNRFFSYNVENNTLKSNYIHTVYEDSDGYSWILTRNGVVRVTPENESTVYFANNQDENNPFYAVSEAGNEIWFGTNKGRIWCYDRNENRFSPFDTGVDSDIISIKKIYENLLIVLTSEDGFIICDSGKTSVRKYDRTTLRNLPTNEMVSCFIDRNNNIWFEMDCPGVAKFNTANDQLTYYELTDPRNTEDVFGPNFSIVEDKAGRIWVHPHRGGFSYYDKNKDKLLPFYNVPNSPDYKFSDKLHDLFVDKQGNLWLSTRSSGVEKVVFDNEMFQSDDFSSNVPLSVDDEVRAIFEDKDKNIWLASKDRLITVYDRKKNFKGYLCADGSMSATAKLWDAMTYTFFQDGNTIWIGSKGSGVYVLEPGGNPYKITQYKNSPSDKYSLSDDRVYSIHKDKEGRIWVGTYGGGLNLFDRKNNRFINYHNELTNYPIETAHQIRSINTHEGKIYAGTTLGLMVFSSGFDNPNNIDYKIYTKTYRTEDGLKANDIYNIYVTKNNAVFISTFGGGLSKVTGFDGSGFPSVFKTYDTTNGLPSDIVLSIIEDNNNNIWINSEGYLTRLNPQHESLEQFNDVNRVLDNHFFSEASPLLSSDGEIIMGTTKGTITFLPETISRNNYNPYLALIKFSVSNKNYPQNAQIDDLDKITLNHNENIFSIEFAALDYTDPKGISYAYKLEGVDKDWTYSQSQRVVNYAKLPPGEYIFKVKSTNSDGTWVNNERSLFITIEPAFWQTNWAYFIYILVLGIILFIILRTIFVFYRMKDKVLLEHEQTEMKTRFFTDISHEIRTPLTMIVSPLENILEDEDTSEKAKPQLRLILKNANRMLNMVNQILDFRKIQKQKLKVKETVIGNLMEEICENLAKTAESQGIVFNVINQAKTTKIWVDTDSIEKLIFNLVSNSIKHTEKGKKIEVRIFKKDKSTVALEVKDQGRGMTKEVMNKLFTRFGSFSSDKSKPSTGIGLSIVKEVVDKHHAKITVESDANKGSVFTVYFQTGLEHFSYDNNVEIINFETEYTEKEPAALAEDSYITEDEAKKSLSILVVEDDHDLRNFIKSILSPHYSVLEAKNGKEGYETAVREMPDFILSDIMMPEMDGIEFLHKIRENHETSHMPFILLTAKTNIDDRLEGITLGADDYITKPFNVKLLKAKIDNIIEQRKRLADHIMGNKPAGFPSETTQVTENYKITQQDEGFLKELQANIVENMDNGDLSIDDLVSKTRFSRRVFFNKVKSLTGLSPIEFVRETRIKQSAELLKNKEYRVKEVTYMIGFSDRKYFTQCFKKLYGVTPTEYRRQFVED